MNITKLLVLLLAIAQIACKNATEGTKAAVSEAAEKVAETVGENYNVDLAASNVAWTGTKITGSKHMGTIGLKSGNVAVNNGEISGGKFVMDIASLAVTDLKSGKGKEKLEGHLKNEDFFDAPKFPTSTFEITKVTKLTGEADATHLVYGNLTLKDVTKEIGFKAKVEMGESGVSVSTPDFTINRTDFGIQYGSGSFFDDLGDKAINDEVGLSISLKTS